ncbi:MAG: phosphate ABC transporter permease PstA [Bifidobacteriaceae bacterium]|nr:phosphate ABC transporter permease PstA [Bifidobacteriaceae bacterium]
MNEADRRPSFRSISRRRKNFDLFMKIVIFSCFILVSVPLISIIYIVIVKGFGQLTPYFLTHTMKGVMGGFWPFGGILHALLGTILITFGAMIISIPIGVATAIYLVEYSKKNKLSNAINIMVDIMSGVPSIVAGLFAYSLFALFLGPKAVFGFSGSAALAVLMIPTIVRSTQEMLNLVPNELREASFGLGVSKFRTIAKVVLPTAFSGIVTGILLSVARVIGETAPLLLTAGTIDSLNWNLFSGRMMSLPVYIYNEYSQGLAICSNNLLGADCLSDIRMQRAWSAALVLFGVIIILNLVGNIIRLKVLRKRGK